ncbi:MAG: hypothetical protein ACOX5G_10570 [Kiritimatiellia bacterium]|jgi:hypothetical protein
MQIKNASLKGRSWGICIIVAVAMFCLCGCMGPHVGITDSALFNAQSFSAPNVDVVRLPNYPVAMIMADYPVVVRLVNETSHKVLDEQRMNMRAGICETLNFSKPELTPGQYRVELLRNGEVATSRSFSVVK